MRYLHMPNEGINKRKLEANSVEDAGIGVEDVDLLLREYNRMLHAHHRYTQKIRRLSSLGEASMNEDKQEQYRNLDIKRNLVHRELIDLATKVGKSSSDVAVDLLLLDGGGREFKLDVPIIAWENSPDIADREKQRRESPMISEIEEVDLQNFQPIRHDEAAILVGTEVSEEFDREGVRVSTYGMQMNNQQPAVRTFTFSDGFRERIAGVERLVHDHPSLAQLYATGAFYFHNSTRSYGIVVKKSDLIRVCNLLRDNALEYLPPVKSKGDKICMDKLSTSEIIASIPSEMLCFEDLVERMGEEQAKEYIAGRWGKEAAS